MKFKTIRNSSTGPKELVKKIEQARRLAFPEFDQITLEPGAVQVLANLFLNPDCQSDVNLAQFIDKNRVKLSQISPHIITAAPSTLAKYAQDHDKLKISQTDILKCFALDHAQAIKINRIDSKFSPTYGLAHLLNVGRIVKIRQVNPPAGGGKKFVDLEKKFNTRPIVFKNVLVPDNLEILPGLEVFHHFGVVVAVADKPELIKLADKIRAEQKKEHFIYKINQGAVQRGKLIIDARDKTIFHENLMEKIILTPKIKPAQPSIDNIGKGKIIFSK